MDIPLEIPTGWRKLAPHEIRAHGDRFYREQFWHAALVFDIPVSDYLVFIRPLYKPVVNPNLHEFQHKRFENPVPPKETTSDKVAKYLNKLKNPQTST